MEWVQTSLPKCCLLYSLFFQFDLVCDKDWYRHLYQMLFTAGCVIGGATGGVLGDR